ncbi:cysteine--tRNA ligase [Gynuella sunshinyii]|uniref:Cysteine--tRNA ligase n=1 Tax=Gynuella sunshinyii YC6258 TaxID=1445510 RepID=A0A0C5VAD0_9GAMM|nr:cysteine--tRNA ligase [Gynuella sunshinyii]AJQ96265.1 cysteinyl-tRNA synthetase [Gynuella sunshinyii YC6258]
MEIKIHNTLVGSKQVFKPIDPEKVTIYVCGPTVYNRIHIGNARPAVIFDTFVRLLRQIYPKVVYARNITDVDDKINNAARELGVDISVVAEKYALAYQEDMAALHNFEPDIQPRATEHIDEMINIIQALIDRGHAYVSDHHVLFNVPSMADYGKLSKRNIDDMIAGARVEVASYKKDPMDFVLWKPSTDDLPGWDSPWGRGRPGWHIECSAMIQKHLGETIDIHGGGADLVFPHHENELAQGTCCHDHPVEYVRYWMHNGMLNIGGEKMSKSLGNFITVAELLEQYQGEVLRFALLSAQYRSLLNFTDDLLNQSKAALDRFYTVLRELKYVEALPVSEFSSLPVVKALADDMNTPEALAAMHQLASELFKATDPAEKAKLKGQFVTSGQLLGLFNHDPEQWFKQGNADSLSEALIDAKIQERADAKKARDFGKADEIRNWLLERGVEIQDTREGTRWQRI